MLHLGFIRFRTQLRGWKQETSSQEYERTQETNRNRPKEARRSVLENLLDTTIFRFGFFKIAFFLHSNFVLYILVRFIVHMYVLLGFHSL